MAATHPVTVTVWQDYTCPFCYVSLGRLDLLARELDFQVDRRPFLLNPDRPAEGEPRRLFDGETETELSPAMQERARGAGLVMRRPQWSPNTIAAHEVTLFAKERGLDDAFHHAAAAAFWERGADLNDHETLRQLAESCGLAWAELGPLLESGHYRQQVLDEAQSARTDRDIGGTPTYLIGGHQQFGDLSVDELRQLIQAAAQ